MNKRNGLWSTAGLDVKAHTAYNPVTQYDSESQVWFPSLTTLVAPHSSFPALSTVCHQAVFILPCELVDQLFILFFLRCYGAYMPLLWQDSWLRWEDSWLTRCKGRRDWDSTHCHASEPMWYELGPLGQRAGAPRSVIFSMPPSV